MVRKEKSRKEGLPPITCKGCGTRFVPKSRGQHYHSETCREEYYQRTYFSKKTARKTCPNCGMEFITTKPGRQAYCSPECRGDARIKRKEGIIASLSAERKTFLSDRFAAMEKDSFRCVYCGRGVRDGAKLDVEGDDKGGLCTICDMCREGREFSSVHNVKA